MTGRPQQSSSPLLRLPSELTESIIVFATALGCPTAVSAIAQTCRVLRQLVYEAPDRHLWRELFLATFDDPRPSLKADYALTEAAGYRLADGGTVSEGEQSKTLSDEAVDGFDWGSEFRARVWARNYLRGQSNLKGKSTVTQKRHEMNAEAVAAIIRAIETAKPSPPVVFLPQPSEDSASDDDVTWVPTFPPAPSSYSVVLCEAGSLPSAARKTSTSPSSGPLEPPPGAGSSTNIRWLQEILDNGLPPDLVNRLAGEQLYGGLQGVWDSPVLAREMRAFCRLICCTGFVPVPQPEESTSNETEASPAPASDIEDEALLFSSRPSTTTAPAPSPKTSMAIKDQRIRARRMARMRVYNLRYLNQARHWGPYLLPQRFDNTASEKLVRKTLIAPVLDFLSDYLERHWFHVHEDESDDEEEDSSDDEYMDTNEQEDVDLGDSELEKDDGGDQNDTRHQGDREDRYDENKQNSAKGVADEHDEQSPAEEHNDPEIHHEGISSSDSALSHTPTPNELRADWTFLAAVRIVVEENLREIAEPSDLAGLFSLELLRRHSAPRALASLKDVDHTMGGSTNDVEGGWDWAGVTGSWRRCVCWMDYRALIRENAGKPQNTFADALVREANRIVPTNIYIESYSPCSIPKYRHRPDIHVAATVTSPHGGGPIRKMKGTVGMIGDGSIRWSMYSLVDGEDFAEWASEGIQVGQCQSGIGILGMWTGAQHDRQDPLGPFWMWKVG